MKLWILSRLTNDATPIYDCHDGHVIAAPDEAAARKMAADRAGDEKARAWIEGGGSVCEHLGESLTDDVGIVLSDFHAG
jgi:hypothetical protein